MSLIDEPAKLEKSTRGKREITFDQQHARRVINKIIHQRLYRVQRDSFQ